MRDGKLKVASKYIYFNLEESHKWGKKENPKFLWKTSEGKFVELVYTPWWSKTTLHSCITWDFHKEYQVQHAGTWKVFKVSSWYLVTMFKKMREACQPLVTSTIQPIVQKLLFLKSYMMHLEVSRSQENGFINFWSNTWTRLLEWE
jgi:hypothetical protein